MTSPRTRHRRLAFASGLSGARDGRRGRGVVLLASMLFVLGFAVFFTILGGASGGLGWALAEHRQRVGALGGVLVLGMGLFLLDRGAGAPAGLRKRSLRLERTGGASSSSSWSCWSPGSGTACWSRCSPRSPASRPRCDGRARAGGRSR